jgi:hypothetical protein
MAEFETRAHFPNLAEEFCFYKNNKGWVNILQVIVLVVTN